MVNRELITDAIRVNDAILPSQMVYEIDNHLHGNFDQMVRTGVISILMLWAFVAVIVSAYDPENRIFFPCDLWSRRKGLGRSCKFYRKGLSMSCLITIYGIVYSSWICCSRLANIGLPKCIYLRCIKIIELHEYRSCYCHYNIMCILEQEIGYQNNLKLWDDFNYTLNFAILFLLKQPRFLLLNLWMKRFVYAKYCKWTNLRK